MSRPVGLQPDDLTRVMSAFGVAETQVRRDHAVSHILATLSQHHRDDLATMLSQDIYTGLASTHGRLTWTPP